MKCHRDTLQLVVIVRTVVVGLGNVLNVINGLAQKEKITFIVQVDVELGSLEGLLIYRFVYVVDCFPENSN